MTAQKSMQQWRPLASGIIIGSVVSIVLSVALSGVFALLIHNGQLNENLISSIALGILFVAPFLGSLLGGKWVRKKPAVICGLVGGSFALVLLGITVFAFDASFKNVLGSLVSIILGCGCACMLCAGKSGQRKRRSR